MYSIKGKVFAELHVRVDSVDELAKILQVLEELGVDVVGVVNRSAGLLELQERTRALLLSKLYLTDCSREVLRRARRMYDIVAVRPENRFRLNKLIRAPEINVITLDFSDERQLPSRDQVKVMASEGKALEILIGSDLLSSQRMLGMLCKYLESIVATDDLVLIFSQNIRSVRDVRNPRDLMSFIAVLVDVDKRLLDDLRARLLDFLSDVFYLKGVKLS